MKSKLELAVEEVESKYKKRFPLGKAAEDAIFLSLARAQARVQDAERALIDAEKLYKIESQKLLTLKEILDGRKGYILISQDASMSAEILSGFTALEELSEFFRYMKPSFDKMVPNIGEELYEVSNGILNFVTHLRDSSD